MNTPAFSQTGFKKLLFTRHVTEIQDGFKEQNQAKLPRNCEIVYF